MSADKLSAIVITILRVYGVSVRDWRLVVIVTPLAFATPASYIVGKAADFQRICANVTVLPRLRMS